MIIDQAFDNAAHKELGQAMAQFLLESAQRPGFFRTLDFHTKNHTVDEFTVRERVQIERIKRKHRHLFTIDDRYFVRQLRRQSYDGPKSTRRRYTTDLCPYQS